MPSSRTAPPWAASSTSPGTPWTNWPGSIRGRCPSYYYRLASTGLGEFHMPLYAGLSLEAGNAWAARSDISGRTLIYAGSLLVGAET